MRHLAVIFTFMSLMHLNNPASGQPNGYFDNDPRWRITSTCADPLPCLLKSEYIYQFGLDTMISGISYKKLERAGFRYYQWMGGSPPPQTCLGLFTFKETAGFIRQQDKKVYIYEAMFNTDTLLYDFDLSVGDTMPGTFIHNYTNFLTVSSIDSIYTSGGYRKKFNFGAAGSIPFIIEGIGHTGGFIEPIPPIFDCGYNLECYTLNDTAYYPAPGATCNVIVSQHETAGRNHIKLSPNPASDQLYITGRLESICKLTVLTMSGTPLVEEEFNGINVSDRFILDVSVLPVGVYVLRTETLDGRILTLKFSIIR